MTNKHQWYTYIVEYAMKTKLFQFQVYEDNREGEWSGASWLNADHQMLEHVEHCKSPEEAQRQIVEQTLRLVNIWREELEGVLAAGWETVKDE